MPSPRRSVKTGQRLKARASLRRIGPFRTWQGALGCVLTTRSSICSPARAGSVVSFHATLLLREPTAVLHFVNAIWLRQCEAQAQLANPRLRTQHLLPLSASNLNRVERKMPSPFLGDDVPIKQVAFADQGRSPLCDLQASSPWTPAPRRRHSTPPPRSACVEPDTLRGEGFATGTLTLVRLWPFFGTSKDRKWYIYLGRSQGISPDSRRNERVLGLRHLGSLGMRGARAVYSATSPASGLACTVLVYDAPRP